ncbi:nicotinate phosphoribosyltransferase, partial [bacterium BMS3Abin03]|nr:nicotinate phosphoribosyltransferase [bacterium BMS3Abin03]
NQLNEYLIKSLLEQGAPIDGFGVGTELITGQPDAALDGVYKLGMVDSNPSFKLSENLEKVTLPGVKKIHRYINGDGKFYADGILLDEEDSIDRIFHPSHSHKSADVQDKKQEELLELMMKNGEIKIDNRSVKEISEYRKYRLSLLPDEHKRFENPHTYKIGISKKLGDLRNSLIAKLLVSK